MTNHTTSSLRANRHRVERRLEQADFVLTAMQRGAVLHLQFTQHGPHWTLTGGGRVADDVAQLVIASASVASVGDALFGECLAQSWRWWNA